MDRAKLNKMYPLMVVRNRRSHAIHVPYLNGDSAQIQPMATATISSINLLTVPNHNEVELVNPTIFDLHKEDIITLEDNSDSSSSS